MIKKHLLTIPIIIMAVSILFFGVRYFAGTKKTVSVSVTDLASQESGASRQESATTDQEPTTSEQEAVTDKQVPDDNKKPDADNQPPQTNEKVSVKNVQQPESKSDDSKNDDVKSSGKIVSKLVSWGFQKSSGRNIKAVIVHTSYNAIGGDVFDFDKVIQEWKDAGVAPHYAIDRKGAIYQLVADQHIAWHAGASKLPDGTTDVNGTSIGIEVINSKDAKFTSDQYAALNSLLVTLKKNYDIKYILGHEDIAPGRKTDPWGIEWGKVRK